MERRVEEGEGENLFLSEYIIQLSIDCVSKQQKCLLLKYLFFWGPEGPHSVFTLFHICIRLTSGNHSDAAAAAPSALSATVASPECFSLREKLFPMSPWGRRPEDTPWGCCCCCGGGSDANGVTEVNRPVWEFCRRETDG